MRFGLTEKTIEQINAVFERHPAIRQVLLFGSRAKGNYRAGSDIDLTIHGDAISSGELDDINTELDDLLLPNSFDLSVFADIDHAKLREHIERVGVVFYQRGSTASDRDDGVKAGWQRMAIGDICDVVNGGTPKTGTAEYWDGPHQWITPAEMGKRASPYIDQTERAITDAGLQNSSARLLPPQSVILSSRAPIGHLVINTAPMATNQGCKGLVPRSGLDCKYLYYYLASIVPLLNDLGTGATFKELSGGKLKGVPVPVPSLPEQHRIVALLDEAFAGIATARAHAEQNLQNTRALFESQLQAVFSQRGEGWKEDPLSFLCNIKHGFAFKSEFFTSDGEYVLLTPGNFYESGGYRDRGEKQKYYCGEIPPGFILEQGDLLVAMTEQAAGLLGSSILVPSYGKYLHNQRLGLVVGKPGVPWSNEFFFHVFNTPAVRKAIHDSASGVKVRHTSPGKIGEVVVAFPQSIDEQKAIVAQLETLQDETQRLESRYQRKLDALDELKRSLLHQAFSGQL
jgi:type I restriction enzyme S subunit